MSEKLILLIEDEATTRAIRDWSDTVVRDNTTRDSTKRRHADASFTCAGSDTSRRASHAHRRG